MRKLRIGLAQINTTVGDLEGNVGKVLDYVSRARDLGVDIVSFPELTVTGYPPEDLLLRPSFVQDNLKALETVIKGCGGITAVVGFVDRDDHIYNAAALIHDSRLAGVYRKQLLPNYGVFDEERYFQAGTDYPVYTVAGVGVGINICEDIWYPGDPTQAQAQRGAEVILNINGSPYHAGKRRFREQMLAARASDYGLFVCYTNQVGGQDELVFRRRQHGVRRRRRAHSPGCGLRGRASGLRSECRRCAGGAPGEEPHTHLRSAPDRLQTDHRGATGFAPGRRGGDLHRPGHRHPRLCRKDRDSRRCLSPCPAASTPA